MAWLDEFNDFFSPEVAVAVCVDVREQLKNLAHQLVLELLRKAVKSFLVSKLIALDEDAQLVDRDAWVVVRVEEREQVMYVGGRNTSYSVSSGEKVDQLALINPTVSIWIHLFEQLLLWDPLIAQELGNFLNCLSNGLWQVLRCLNKLFVLICASSQVILVDLSDSYHNLA